MTRASVYQLPMDDQIAEKAIAGDRDAVAQLIADLQPP